MHKPAWPLVLALVSALLSACSGSARPTASASPSPLVVATGDYPMYGNAADFSWLAGRIERNLSCTYLRFGNRRRSVWAGSIALVEPEAGLDAGDGDMVVVHGRLSRLSAGVCGAPSYVVDELEEH